MASLALFCDQSTGISQAANKAFGIDTSDPNKFRVDSIFNVTGTVKAYAMVSGTVLLQQQTGLPAKVNLILRPHNQSDLKLPIKYIIYRGLETNAFIDSNNLADPNNKVKTTGSEFLAAMQTIQQQRAPGDDIPIQALFGNELTPAGTKNIDEFFFQNLAAASQLFTIDCGIDLGKFATGQVSIEVILENPEYFLTVEDAKKPLHEINVTGLSGAEKKFKQDLVRHFADPAAYYGLHHDIAGGIEYRTSSGKQSANTPALVYSQIVNKFLTKNKVYLDVRNENGYSYNYYGNYVGTGTDANKNIKIGQTAATLVAKEYYTNGWAIHTIDVTAGSGTENEIFIALRINDNERPLIAGWNYALSNTSGTGTIVPDNNVYFADEIVLLSNPVSDFTNVISFKVPNVSGSTPTQLSTIFKLDYIKQLRINDGVDSFPQENPTDFLFGPISTEIPWDSNDGVQWIGSNHFRYFDGLNHGFITGDLEENISALNSTLKTITINKKIDTQITNIVQIKNAVNTQNVGIYNVLKVETPTATTTVITVRESFPGSLQTGDKLLITVEAAVVIDYSNKKVIAQTINLSNNSVFAVGKRVRIFLKKGVETINTILTNSFLNGNTEIVFNNNITKQGFGCIIGTGMVSEIDLSPGPNPPDNDNILFYAVPQFYYNNAGGKNSNLFNYKGATYKNESFIKVIQKINSDFKIEKFSLQPTTGNFIATLAYSEDVKVRENILLLGLKKSEFEDLQTAAATQLSSYHIQTLKLKLQGNRQRDKDYEPYYKYHLVVTGLDNAGDYTETTVFKEIYSRDGFIFTSPEYASHIISDVSPDLDMEEQFHLNANLTSIVSYGEWEKKQDPTNNNSTFKYLYETLGADLKIIVDDFKTAIEALTTANFKTEIENIIKQKGNDLLNTARTNIRNSASTMYNKDGALYLARLQMRKLIKQHPLVSASFVSYDNVQQYLDLLEKVSRGLHSSNKPDFSTHPTHIPILISGYDPFRAIYRKSLVQGYTVYEGLDAASHLSNSSGNIALSLNNIEEVHISTGKKAIIKGVVFPVRYKEFNEGWIEDFFEQYINPNHPSYQPVKMIITFSYGVESTKYSFEMERFAASMRGVDGIDNNQKEANLSGYLQLSDKDEFINSNLPFQKLFILDKVGLDQKSEFEYWNNNSFVEKSYINNYNINNPSDLINRTDDPFKNRNYNNFNNDLKATYDQYYELPDIINYPAPPGVTADKIKSLQGSGGDYLSNEIFYRVAFLRKKYNSGLMTGHIHVGYLKRYDYQSGQFEIVDLNKNDMITLIRQAIRQAIEIL